MRYKTRSPHSVLTVWLTALALTLSCYGQGVTYTSRRAFDAGVAGLAGSRLDVNFEGPLSPGGTDLGGGIVRYFPPLTVSGLTFSSAAPLLIRFTFTNGRWLNNYDSLLPLMVEPGRPAVAFGADFAGLVSPFTDFLATVTLDNGEVFTFMAPADPGRTFFGFVSTQPFSSFTFSDGDLIGGRYHGEILDNITVVTVPEPRAFALFALGALLLGWRFSRGRR